MTPGRTCHRIRDRVLCALVIASAAGWPGQSSAQGCGPTRLKTTESVSLDVPPSTLWALVGNFQDMSWDENVASATGTGGNAAETAVRTLTLKGGAKIGESLYKYDAAAMSYSYHIDRVDVSQLPVQNASATLEVVPLDGGARSRLVWRSAFYRFLKPGEPAPDIADLQASRAMSNYLRSGLESVKARFDPSARSAPKARSEDRARADAVESKS